MRALFMGAALAALNIADEGGGGAVVVVTPPTEPETASVAAVEIAEIEANRDIRLAEIEAAGQTERREADIAASEAFGEALAEGINESLEAEKTEWQIRAETAEAELAALKAQAPSIPPASPPEPLPSPPPVVAVEGPREAEPEAGSESPPSPPSPPAEPPRRHKKARWI